ncbi:Flp pilus assembly protein CpaB [Belnapia rosea]|uniref:Flp pilus assembly protein CpaB n=1 Tax=Belnapia rosea TaxID=938405 RepID=UPI000885A58A|nr:Flp pilus assembly protein CpaB [Belnapia rosea]SDB74474.1 pilus assembly protein CpaB [Belnapia rosea]
MLLRLLVIASLLLSALGLGGLSYQMLAPRQVPVAAVAVAPPPPPPPRLRIAVAARGLPAGTLLKDEDLAIREVAPDAVPEGAIAAGEESRTELRGALLRRYLDPDAVLRREDVLRPRDRGFLAGVLRSGTRAISVGVDVITGAAGLIWPGDQVDLILTQELAANDAPLARRVIGETVLTDVRVIAVDQQFTRGANPGEATLGRIARTVTLEVTAEQAERVAVASRLGRISLTVRAIERPELELATQGGPVFGADVSPALARSAISQGARMRVVQGEEQLEVTFR